MAQSPEQLNQALQNCLQLCRTAPFPLLFMAEFLMVLRAEGNWESKDVADLKSLVARFATNVQRQNQPGDSRLSG